MSHKADDREAEEREVQSTAQMNLYVDAESRL